MIVYKKGDLFRAEEDILAHGCNCQGAYGAGVAKSMAHNHRKARDQYLAKFIKEGWLLGDVQFVSSGQKWIANCATQYDFMPRGVCHVDYDAICETMNTVKAFAQKNGLTIAMPKIGAVLAGGDWGTIEEILMDVFHDYDVTVYEL